jgi:hypothetical protein
MASSSFVHEPLNVTCSLLNGRELTFTPGPDTTVAALKRQVAATAFGTQSVAANIRLCLDGTLLDDRSKLGAALPQQHGADIALTVWTSRWSRSRSEEAHALAATRQRHAAARAVTSSVLRTVRGAVPVASAMLRAVPPRWWAILAVWHLLGYIARWLEMLPLFGFVTAIALIYTNLGERKPGEVSAYTVFNEGMRALPGQLRAEDIERDMLRL